MNVTAVPRTNKSKN